VGDAVSEVDLERDSAAIQFPGQISRAAPRSRLDPLQLLVAKRDAVTIPARAAVAPVQAAPMPKELANLMDGVGPFAAGAANVIMQLSRLPIGRGVAESRVDSGQLDKHPIKRFRTTLSFLVVAMWGTEEERNALRHEINRVHAQVRSRSTDPVAYSAFDPKLQLWVAACLYKGLEDTYLWLHGTPDEATREAIYRHGARFGTTLQVPADMWPADRAAFEKYWDAERELIEMDDVTRAYLTDLANLAFLPTPLSMTLGPLNRLFTIGFLEPRFRDELGLPWTDRYQRIFDGLTRVAAATNRRLPRALREFPLNVYLWDVRRRLHSGRPVI
jgi:uncharacterized protein (DUF2236 family)